MNHIIKLQNSVIYQDKHPVLQDVQLDVAQGEFVYLVGKTGSGKSSLLKTLYGALPLLQGTGEVVGFPLHKLRRKDIPLLRRQLGIVFQDFALLSDRTVASNLLFVLKATGWSDSKAMKNRIGEALASVTMTHKADSFPHQLSGGEQQRIALARALLNSPRLVIADEPTGNLDWDTSNEVMLLLRQLNATHNTAFLMATHDERLIEKYPARIVRCSDGHLSG
ncbi:MAG: ATP-binding cassette domain-containing protein [Saprospiraceae bacterium]